LKALGFDLKVVMEFEKSMFQLSVTGKSDQIACEKQIERS